MKILFCGKFFADGPGMLKGLLPDDDIGNCRVTEASTLGLDSDVLVPLMHRLEPELISGTRARLIHQWGVGLEGVDIPAATSLGIRVCNVPADESPNADSTAEHIIFLMMGVGRRIHECRRAFQEGVWGGPMGETLFGSHALIVGLGRVGKALAARLAALSMNVTAIRGRPDAEPIEKLSVTRVGGPSDLLQMAAEADFVISTAILSEQTRGMFNRELFRAMKPSAIVINASRGPVVDESDLTEALRSGEIRGAGLDVFSREPLDPSNPLLRMDNVFATPHVGGVTRRNFEWTARVVAENIRRFKAGKPLKYCVNESEISP
jgi:phosphoglycerate dehydrogenase-like enzyme